MCGFLPQSKNLPKRLTAGSKFSLDVTVWSSSRLATCAGCAMPSPNSSCNGLLWPKKKWSGFGQWMVLLDAVTCRQNAGKQSNFLYPTKWSLLEYSGTHFGCITSQEQWDKEATVLRFILPPSTFFTIFCNAKNVIFIDLGLSFKKLL